MGEGGAEQAALFLNVVLILDLSTLPFLMSRMNSALQYGWVPENYYEAI